MKIRVAVKNKILGDSVFWEGDCSKVDEIANMPARMLAHSVRQDGIERRQGMWVVSEVKDDSEN